MFCNLCKIDRTAVDVLSTMNSCRFTSTICYECFVHLSAAPPSYPSEVRVFSGSESATIMWEMPGFVQSFFGKVIIIPLPKQIDLVHKNNIVTRRIICCLPCIEKYICSMLVYPILQNHAPIYYSRFIPT